VFFSMAELHVDNDPRIKISVDPDLGPFFPYDAEFEYVPDFHAQKKHHHKEPIVIGYPYIDRSQFS